MVEVLYKLGVLHHVGEEPVLEQMRLVVLPLCERPLTLSGVVALVEQLLEDLHGMLVRNDSLTVELILTITEADNVVCLGILRGANAQLRATHSTVLLAHGPCSRVRDHRSISAEAGATWLLARWVLQLLKGLRDIINDVEIFQLEMGRRHAPFCNNLSAYVRTLSHLLGVVAAG